MDGIKLFFKITDWKPTRTSTKGRPKNRWRDKVINYVKKLKLRNCIQLVKEQKTPE
jgi:hypothetical protein